MSCHRSVQSKQFLLLLIFWVIPFRIHAATWARAYFDSNQDHIFYSSQIVRTNDGNYVALVSDTLIKINPLGTILKQKKIQTVQIFSGWQFLRKTRDGGFLIAGNTSYVTEGSTIIAKLNKNFELAWSREISIAYEIFVFALDVNETADGGVIVGGNTYYFVPASAVFGKTQAYNAWLAKLDRSGNLQWKYRYNMKKLTAIREKPDDGYIAASAGGSVVKFNPEGIPQWQKKYGEFVAVLELSQNSEIVLATNPIKQSIRVLKLKANGEILWQKKYNAKNSEHITKVRISNSGNIFLAGYTGYSNASSIVAYKLDPTGMLLWKKTYGLPKQAQKTDSIIPTTDGGLLIAGFNWILKTDANGQIENLCNDIVRSEASSTQNANLHASRQKPAINGFALTAGDDFAFSVSDGRVQEETICTSLDFRP